LSSAYKGFFPEKTPEDCEGQDFLTVGFTALDQIKALGVHEMCEP